MKKRKFLKRASVIALSAVMTAGVALAAAACGGDGGLNEWGYKTGTPGQGTDPDTLTVYIFCNDSDAETNRQICNTWMDKYNAAHQSHHKISLVNQKDKETYFGSLTNYWSSNQMYDIIYLAPRYVRSYAETGSVLNIADYLDTVCADPSKTGDEAKEANKQVFGQIWKNAASYYSYQKGKAIATTDQPAYALGQPVTYNAEKNGFYTDASNGTEEVGIYGLPKDYSNFSTGYNNLFFTEEIKEGITTTKPISSRGVTVSATVEGAKNETPSSVSADRRYTTASGEKTQGGSAIIQYAASGEYTNPYTGETETVTAGAEANIINVGVPTRYYPFNFFRYNSYTEALAGGDPLALLCEAYTGGEGYVVTIPGFPNDVVKMPENIAKDSSAPYDTSIGHMTYTYGEYSAFIWAMTYYLNTCDWQEPGSGKGGVDRDGAGYLAVFGGEQFEGKSDATVGSVLYLLPWLYGNDADLINATYTLCSAREVLEGGGFNYAGAGVNLADAANWREIAGTRSNKVSKMNLDGTTREVDVQYGFNSQRFIETYGAFLALASDWNGNNGGDSKEDSKTDGWTYFRAGRSLFYGAGSWDGATRNDTHADILEFGQMPTPVSEDYALYSKIKGANYTMETYSNGATSKGTGNDAANDKVQRTNVAEGCQIYNAEAIAQNQALRQDKWGARMDSVGYAVNGQVTNYTGEHAWKAEAAVSLVMALTVDRDSQVALTYAGAQYPNFRDQMEQFVDYQKYGENGAFKDMITPEGDSSMHYYKEDGTVDDTVKPQAEALWNEYYEIAKDMEEQSRQNSTQTVEQYLATKTINGKPVKYDETYKDLALKNFTGAMNNTRIAYAMKVLYMVPITRANREINIRMQYGLNAVRDSTMYTYSDRWLATVDARSALTTMFAYTHGNTVLVGGQAMSGSTLEAFRKGVKQSPDRTEATWETPLLFCLRLTETCQNDLSKAVSDELSTLTSI